MNKDKQDLPNMAKIIGFDLPKEIDKLLSEDRTTRNKIEIEIYNIENTLNKIIIGKKCKYQKQKIKLK